MKYEEDYSSNQKKFSTGLVITIALALLLIAGASWFALSRYNSNNKTNSSVSSVKSDLGSAVSENESNFNSSTGKDESDINSIVSEIIPDTNSEYQRNVSSYNSTVSGTVSNLDGLDNTAPTDDKTASVPYNVTAFMKPAEGEILKDFSDKNLQYSKTFGDMRLHNGIDIACKKGTAVSVCGDGVILTVEKSSLYGNVVTIDLGNGLSAKYCSLDNVKFKEGDQVKLGDILGNTTTIPAECDDKEHLHFEVYKNGTAVSPLKELGLE